MVGRGIRGARRHRPESGQLATNGCPQPIEEVFIAGTEPEDSCSVHRPGFLQWWRKLLRRFKDEE
jgi:uncharacterized membrane protein